MRRSPLVLALLIAPLAACQPQSTPAPSDAASQAAASTTQADAKFAALSKRWLDGWLQLNPINATQVGDHRFDREVDDLSTAGRQKSVTFSKRLLAELDAIDTSKLSRENQVDAAILRNQLRGDIWSIETLQSWAWDPQVYSKLAGSALYNLMKREFAPLPERLKSATVRMQKIPAIFAQARENLDPARVPETHAKTVSDRNRGILSLIDTFITPNAGQLSGEERAQLDAAVEGLQKAVAEQQTWLDKTLLPNAKGDFRLGQKLYDEKLQFTLNSTLSRAQIRQRAETELGHVREQMYGIAQTVLKDRPNAPDMPARPSDEQRQKAIEAALELAYAEKPARDQVIDFAKQTLAEATAFIRAKDLATVPNDPVKVILVPEFLRGIGIAYCDSPGPLDQGLDTYYAISPIPDDWSAEQVDSYLREYNNRALHLLSIHEAMPGHYLEGAHSARHPSTLRAVLRSGPFAEGWAVYSEDMMADAGYLAHDPLFRLIQLKHYLRSVSALILDQGVHVDGWSEQQAREWMARQTFRQERQAAAAWNHVQLAPTQSSTYFVAAQEFFDLRKAMEARLGAQFDAKAYHDQVLSHGAPPVRFVRQLMLDEPIM